jgi:carotenoid cleavage dioxygenase-like enzyme
MQPRTGTKAVLQAIRNSLQYDNACVNVWNYDPSNRQSDLQALTDTPARAGLNHKDFSTLWSSSKAPKPLKGVFGYEFTETAHPLYSLTSNDTYNVAVCLTPRGSQLALVKETPTGCRTVVSKVTTGGAPYLHSFGLTDRHAVIVVPPQRINLRNLPAFLQKGMLRSLVDVNSTSVFVFDLTTGECVLQEQIDEKIYFFHTVSTATSTNDKGEEQVGIRLCAYHTDDVLSGDDQFMRLERCQSSKEARNRITRGGTFCDVVCNLQTKHVGVQWRPIGYGQGFELPVTRYSRSFGPNASFVSKQHPQFVYAYGTYALGSDQYDSWALFKFEPEKGTIAGVFRRESVYVSEPAFIANPKGSSEDDGVLLSQVYDGNRQETALLVIDAKTMKVLAEAWTGNRSPMDFHGGWFPAAKDEA